MHEAAFGQFFLFSAVAEVFYFLLDFGQFPRQIVEPGATIRDRFLMGAGSIVYLLESLEDPPIKGGLLGACRARDVADGQCRGNGGETKIWSAHGSVSFHDFTPAPSKYLAASFLMPSGALTGRLWPTAARYNEITST